MHPVRCFPLTEPDIWISLVDARGREVAVLPELNALSVAQRTMIDSALGEREFVPSITAIERIVVTPAHGQWHVITDRGKTCFSLGH